MVSPGRRADLQNPSRQHRQGTRARPTLPGEGTWRDPWDCSCHPSPRSHLVEGKSLYHHPLVGIFTDGKGSLGLQEVVDLLIVHLRRTEARERPERQGPSGNLSPRGWEG